MKEIERATQQILSIASKNAEIMAGKTQLALKAVCAIYSNMVNKVASATDEIFDINWIKEKINE